jgi:hypothetical protein
MCDSPSLGRCGILANALFPRLVAQADDQGRLAGDSYAVLVACMGRHMREVRVDQIEDALHELELNDVLQRYTVRGAPFIQLTSWWRWQSGQRRAYPSRWPPPRGWYDLVYGCAAAPKGADYFENALDISPLRNAAIRGIPRQPAAERSEPPLRARQRARARAQAGAVPVPDTMPSPARAGAREAPRGGPPESAGQALSEFRKRVPAPGGQ